MKNNEQKKSNKSQAVAQNGKKANASFQVIVLGSTGGPREDSITGLLVRSTFTEWSKGSVIAVDAGAHLASIIRILEEQLPTISNTKPPKDHQTILEKGPFAGLKLPNISARANALYIFRELVHSFLITHPHLDHLSGLCINTPALEYGREAKAIVALPSTIEAIKTHIFNDLIWPNLSDESDGVGFVTYRRLIEGGNPRLGSGDGRGYVSVCNGLLTKCWTVSHGRCKRRGSISHVHSGSLGFSNDPFTFPPRRISRTSDENPHSQHDISGQGNTRMPTTPGASGFVSDRDPNFSTVDSSAFFLRNETDGSEIIVFGDVEPDSVSNNPRNHIVWEDAAQKIAKGYLKAIFIECSYDDSVRDQELYGHLCPRHLITELRVLGSKVVNAKKTINLQEPPSPTTQKAQKKRKRTSDLNGTETNPSPLDHTEYVGRARSKSRSRLKSTSLSRRGSNTGISFVDDIDESSVDFPPAKLPAPLTGVQVFLIHVKDTLTDGPQPGDIILKELREQGEAAGLGCTFKVTKCGEEIWL